MDIYFDNSISANNITLHDLTLQTGLESARQNNVEFNYEKFQYKPNEIRLISQIISKNNIFPDKKIIKAVEAIETPIIKRNCLKCYFFNFLPNLSQLTCNLRKLTKNNVPFILKSIIKRYPVFLFQNF